jgi:hypothetical protein
MAKKTKQQRRSQRRQKRSDQALVGLTTTTAIFPSMWRGKMFYDTTFSFTIPATSAAATVLRANGVFDPDFSGVGTTVAGYNQAAAVYSRYRVLGVRGTFDFASTSAVPGTVFVAVNNLNTVGTNAAEIMAQRHIWKKALSGSTGAGSLTHSIRFPIHKVYGVSKMAVKNEDDFASLTSASPNNQVFIHVGGHSPTASNFPFFVNIRLEYDTVWSLPLDMEY